ncbi:MAG: ribosome silencing factor, partial [Candidatus Omnitrophica bacterium]|nr:ribosome silencing factor [Candidatus Omnitrophota bacterium]
TAKRERVDVETLAVALAKAIDDKKGERIEVLDLRGLTIWADFFVIASAAVRIQIQAMAEETMRRAKEAGCKKQSAEGLQDSDWILIDFADVVVHLMTHESRDFYRLEKLWGDAPKISWNTETNETEKE